MQQVIAARAGVAQPLRRRIAADQESADWYAERVAHALDGRYAGLAVRQAIIGDDQIGLLVLLR